MWGKYTLMTFSANKYNLRFSEFSPIKFPLLYKNAVRALNIQAIYSFSWILVHSHTSPCKRAACMVE